MNSLSNLPPGCSSADGGIDHEHEAAIEKVLKMADDEGLYADELIFAMEVGIAAVKLMRPIIRDTVGLS